MFKMFAIGVLRNALYLEIFVWNIILAEWVDMPQFSNEKKIYRVPSARQDHFYKFSQENSENEFSYDVYKDLKEDETTSNESTTHGFYNAKDSMNEQTTDLFNKATEFVINTEEYDETTMTPIAQEEEPNQKYLNESLISNDTEILNYLPVDVLKNVQRTLESQPTSSEGKLKFLKTFERTLMTEIESRLAQAITGGRERRGTDHYDHGYDNHDHPTGFPSIEGALMAISFLTFAVYLVRLVMLLFRNMNNASSNNNGTTLFLGRRRRSLNRFDEDAAKILSSVDNFSTNCQ